MTSPIHQKSKAAAAAEAITKQDNGYDSDTEIETQKLIQKHYIRKRDGAWKHQPKREEFTAAMLSTRRGEKPEVIKASGVSARILICAESDTFGPLFPNEPNGYYHDNHMLKVDKFGSAPTEQVELSKDSVFLKYHHQEYENRFNVDHPGNYYMHELGKYNDICTQVRSIKLFMEKDPADKDKAIASLLLSYPSRIHAFTEDEVSQRLSIQDIDYVFYALKLLNKLCYNIFVKEVARRLNAKSEKQNLPYAATTIRALKLMDAGKISFKDFFHSDGPYATFAIPNVGENVCLVKRHMKALNRLFMEKFPEEAKDKLRFKKDLTPYGGDSSDDEGYMGLLGKSLFADFVAVFEKNRKS